MVLRITLFAENDKPLEKMQVVCTLCSRAKLAARGETIHSKDQAKQQTLWFAFEQILCQTLAPKNTNLRTQLDSTRIPS